MYTEALVRDFPGLDLTTDPEEMGVNGAVKCLNVDVSRPGTISPRYGTSTFVSNGVQIPLQVGSQGTKVLAFWTDGTVKAYTSAGVLITSGSYTTGGFAGYSQTWGFAGYDYTYFGDPTNGVIQFDGTAFSTATSSAIIAPYLVCAVPYEPRLAAARSTAFPYRVWFTDINNLNWGPSNDGAYHVDLDPGDQEPISALVAWRDALFAFKRSKFYVFRNTSTGSTGDPIFNYRSFNGVGATGSYTTASVHIPSVAVAARDGVYFLADDGVYVTTGDLPKKVSVPLDPWFRGEVTAADLPTGSSPQSIGADNRYLYVAAGTGRCFAMSFSTGRWTVFSHDLYSVAGWPATTTGRETLLGIPGKVVKSTLAQTTDNGTNIDMTYRSGKWDMGIPDVKTEREIIVYGTGTPTLSVYTDWNTSDSVSGALAFSNHRAYQRKSRRGTFFSYEFTGHDFTVERLAFMLRRPRTAAVG